MVKSQNTYIYANTFLKFQTVDIFSDELLSFFFQELLILGGENRLTTRSVISLTEHCPNLRWIGDLRDWNIPNQDRKYVIKGKLSGWEVRRSEPKVEEASEAKIELDTNQIVQGMMFL